MGYGMWNHMFNYGYGYSAWWMLGFMLLRTLITVGVIVFIIKLIKGSGGFGHRQTSSRAMEILKERYAMGEINEEEYNRKYNILKS